MVQQGGFGLAWPKSEGALRFEQPVVFRDHRGSVFHSTHRGPVHSSGSKVINDMSHGTCEDLGFFLVQDHEITLAPGGAVSESWVCFMDSLASYAGRGKEGKGEEGRGREEEAVLAQDKLQGPPYLKPPPA
ncbi:unnamed protein product [Merluccius merluccius]